MSTLKADAITATTTNGNLGLTGNGTGKVAIGDGTLIFPDADGSANQPIITDGSAGLSFGTLPIAGGGTGAATLTANSALLGNGTSALQAIAPGTSGNVLTSDGSTWASSTPAGGGAWNIIGTATASDDATITITGLSSTYEIYAIGFSSILYEAANARLMEVQIGDSGGIITASNYRYNRIDMDTASATATGMNNNGSAEWELTVGTGGGYSAAPYETWGGMFYLQSIQDTWPLLQGTSSGIHDDGQGLQAWFAGQYLGNETVTQLRFRANSGNIYSGRITVWGLAHALIS